MVIIIDARGEIATPIAHLGSTEQFIDSGEGADGIIEKLHFPGSYTSIKCYSINKYKLRNIINKGKDDESIHCRG